MSTTSSSTRRHPASLLPKMMHDPALLEFVRSPVTSDMICTRFSSVHRHSELSADLLHLNSLHRCQSGRRDPMRSSPSGRAPLPSRDPHQDFLLHRSARVAAVAHPFPGDLHRYPRRQVECSSADAHVHARLPRPIEAPSTQGGQGHALYETSHRAQCIDCCGQVSQW